MKVYWRYQCEFGHSWTSLRAENSPENEEDALCPWGHEAVTLSKQPLIDVVEVAIRPAAQVVYPTTDARRVAHDYEFYVVVRDLHDERERMSRRPFTWDEAKNLQDRFRNLPAAKAWNLLDDLDGVDVQVRAIARPEKPTTERTAQEFVRYLVLMDPHSRRERVSRRPIAPDRQGSLVERFRTLSVTRAWKLMDELDKEGSI